VQSSGCEILVSIGLELYALSGNKCGIYDAYLTFVNSGLELSLTDPSKVLSLSSVCSHENGYE
jgi:hypothetical protein